VSPRSHGGPHAHDQLAGPRRARREGSLGAGIDFLRAIAAGELPRAPIQDLLGFDLVEVDEGTLLDSAMGAAVHSTLPEGGAYITLEVKFNLVRPITAETGRVLAEGRVIHSGKAHGTSTAPPPA
jgi:hypothetical protein